MLLTTSLILVALVELYTLHGAPQFSATDGRRCCAKASQIIREVVASLDICNMVGFGSIAIF